MQRVKSLIRDEKTTASDLVALALLALVFLAPRAYCEDAKDTFEVAEYKKQVEECVPVVLWLGEFEQDKKDAILLKLKESIDIHPIVTISFVYDEINKSMDKKSATLASQRQIL